MMNTTRFKARAAIAGGLLAVLTLAGCEKPAPEDQPTETGRVEDTEATEPAPAPPPVAEPAAAPVESAPSVKVPEAAPVAPDAQMLDDADATGMTARLSRDEPSTNEAPPADAPTNTSDER